MTEMNYIDYKKKEIRVCGDIFKPYRRVKTKELIKAQEELSGLSKQQDKIKNRIEKIKSIMDDDATTLEEYDELAKELEKQEAKADDSNLLREAAKIVCPFFEDLTPEEFLDNAEPYDNYTVAVHLHAIQAFNIGKPAKFINDMYIKVVESSIENNMEDIINPRKQ